MGGQFLRLYSSGGSQVAFNNNGASSRCGLCSALNYTVPANSPCQIFTLTEGCAGESTCSGVISVSGGSLVGPPTPEPTPVPSTPPTIRPTAVPTYTPAYCHPYAATNTLWDTQNYAVCTLYACPGVTITASGCGLGACAGDQYLIMYGSNGAQVSGAL